MSGPKHTPGPWSRDPQTDSFNVSNDDGVSVLWGCGCCGSPNLNNPADESLILAAPAMLAGLQRGRRKLATYVSVFPGDKELRGLLVEWDAAIAKATGSAT